MPLQPLSAIQTSNPDLFANIEKLRQLVSTTGSSNNKHGEDNLVEIRDLLASPLNTHGEFFKYYFDSVSDNWGEAWENPDGNNILLLSVARGVNNTIDRDTLVHELVANILDDAAQKFGHESVEFQEFISFKFIDRSGNNGAYCYDNSPLTLAAKAGMIEIASKLVDMGSDVNATSYGTHGNYTALHLLALRLPFTKNPDIELALMQKLAANGASLEQKDSYGRSAKDMVNLHDLHIIDKKTFVFKNEKDAEASNLPYSEEYDAERDGSMSAPTKLYSARELAASESFCAFYAAKSGKALVVNVTEEARYNELRSCMYARHKVDGSKLCESDIHNAGFDASVIKSEEHNTIYRHLMESGVDSHDYRYDAFHGTAHHIHACEILGVEACPGGESCLV